MNGTYLSPAFVIASLPAMFLPIVAWVGRNREAHQGDWEQRGQEVLTLTH
jgi:hypothetical protein